jgi:hypothetical protein
MQVEEMFEVFKEFVGFLLMMIRDGCALEV